MIRRYIVIIPVLPVLFVFPINYWDFLIFGLRDHQNNFKDWTKFSALNRDEMHTIQIEHGK